MSSGELSPALAAVAACGAVAAAAAAAVGIVCLCRRVGRGVGGNGSGSGRSHRRSRSRLLAGDFPEYGVGVVRTRSSKSSDPSSSLRSRPDLAGSVRGSSIATTTDSCRASTCSAGAEDSTSSLGAVSRDLGNLEPALYTRKESVILVSEEGRSSSSGLSATQASNLGQLTFRLGYNFNTSDLLVHVLRAKDLASCDQQKSFIDPFVTLSLEPPVDSKERQTSLQRKTTCPEFNESFKLPLDFDSLAGHRLRLLVQDYDKFSRHVAVGECRVDLASIDVTTEPEVVATLSPSDANKLNNGELLMSLTFLPCAEKLTVAVMKARNLRQASQDRALDPYTRVTLLHDASQLKKKKRTTSKKRAANPVWNEALSFRVAANLLSGLCIEVAVLNRDLLGQDEVIGSVWLGDRPGFRSGRQHWLETVANPRRALAMWHPLSQ